MQFDENKPIYIQIADAICDKVLAREFQPEERIPSVREYGVGIGVNPNTVARSYDLLTERGVIYNKRGIGFFICENAHSAILEAERKRFLSEEWPQTLKRIQLLGLDPEELIKQ